ncbi:MULTISPECIES: hypothetical protein [Paraburkholderia]|uniref:hypothetical protein n=1 Tax=Paraburkholderia TaxID=1822464 RepID=UPI0022539D76|nr:MULTISPECIES: hypothetical protein [Paraburkholderia]MCX4154979.1 hypothetical protein [Paraburkholderia aspalathi]MDN7164389.1 DUF2591 domain-containing protein [Paraburkholderia sp. SECH2]MDQ6392874.1 DUF2591 domain-containing protein [Paraburkholderia aspalathi]
MKIDDLIGAELDYWVARAEGFTAELRGLYGQHYCRIDVQQVGFQIYAPTENSQLAADLAFRRNYTLYPHPCLDDMGTQKTYWLAEAQMNKRFHGMFRDLQPRVAICRLRVAEAIAERALDAKDFVGVIGEKP